MEPMVSQTGKESHEHPCSLEEMIGVARNPTSEPVVDSRLPNAAISGRRDRALRERIESARAASGARFRHRRALQALRGTTNATATMPRRAQCCAVPHSYVGTDNQWCLTARQHAKHRRHSIDYRLHSGGIFL